MTIDPKQLAEAIAIVKRHQDWRRGAEIEMENPKELGVAIDETLEAAKAHLAHLETGGWLDIETAPKDSGTFLICLPRMMNLIIRASYNTVHGHWLSDRETGDGITNLEYFHPGDLWMPLPAPPKGEMK